MFIQRFFADSESRMKDVIKDLGTGRETDGRS